MRGQEPNELEQWCKISLEPWENFKQKNPEYKGDYWNYREEYDQWLEEKPIEERIKCWDNNYEAQLDFAQDYKRFQIFMQEKAEIEKKILGYKEWLANRKG